MMSGSSRELGRELNQINRRIDQLERQAGYAEQRLEMYRRQQWSYAMRPRGDRGRAGHMSKTLAVAGILEKMKRDEEKKIADIYQRQSNLEDHARQKEQEIEQQRERERQEIREQRQREREEHQQQRGQYGSRRGSRSNRREDRDYEPEPI